MAAIRTYINKLPQMYRHRYVAEYWVGWANSLLERLSGAGILPHQPVTSGVIVQRREWINKPPMCRNVLNIRHALSDSAEHNLRFVEENGKLRLLGAYYPLPGELSKFKIPVMEGNKYEITVGGITLDGERITLSENQLANWLFVVTYGSAAGFTFIIHGNSASAPTSGIARLFIDDNAVNIEDELQVIIRDGYIVSPTDYLMMDYTVAFKEIISIDDEFDFGGSYENLVEAWFMWKLNEHVSAISQECVYWSGRVEDELRRIRAEKFNRINKPRGRRLAGFE